MRPPAMPHVPVKARGKRELVTLVGHAAAIAAGEWITASGSWVNDRTHGQQFKARFLKTSAPTSAEGIEKYLASGMIRGIGPVYAKKLVRAFADKVFDIIEAEPDRLREVEGIGPIRASRWRRGWLAAGTPRSTGEGRPSPANSGASHSVHPWNAQEWAQGVRGRGPTLAAPTVVRAAHESAALVPKDATEWPRAAAKGGCFVPRCRGACQAPSQWRAEARIHAIPGTRLRGFVGWLGACGEHLR